MKMSKVALKALTAELREWRHQPRRTRMGSPAVKGALCKTFPACVRYRKAPKGVYNPFYKPEPCPAHRRCASLWSAVAGAYEFNYPDEMREASAEYAAFLRKLINEATVTD